MRKVGVIVLFALLVAAVPAFSQFRADLGLSVPVGGGVLVGETFEGGFFGSNAAIPFIPIPDVGLHYQIPLGFMRVGVGARVLPLILVNVAWPDVYAELQLGSLFLEAHVGGGAIATYIPGAGFGVGFANLILPDVSLWLAPGPKKSFRIGVGALGITSKLEGFDAFPVGVIFYGGVKFVL